MEKTIVKTGKTVEEAKAAALEELGVSEDQATIEVINESEGGFLGMGKQAEVKVTANVEEASEEEEVVYYGDDENFEGDAVSEAEDAAVQFVAEVLSGIGIHGNMDSYREDDTIYISVSGGDCGSAIGRHGETLEAITYMTNLIANKHSEDRVHVHLDVGGYRKHRERIIEGLAERAANKAVRYGKPVAMEPMNPAERRMVHSYLQSFDGVSTHSEGDESNRRVIVTPDSAAQE
ncbi:MAG: Jag N-terminal domain-containing protein [Clostridiales bacterium]|nr:Jag N-terminal domain-containing protein [Clostridiales bacterium]